MRSWFSSSETKVANRSFTRGGSGGIKTFTPTPSYPLAAGTSQCDDEKDRTRASELVFSLTRHDEDGSEVNSGSVVTTDLHAEKEDDDAFAAVSVFNYGFSQAQSGCDDYSVANSTDSESTNGWKSRFLNEFLTSSLTDVMRPEEQQQQSSFPERASSDYPMDGNHSAGDHAAPLTSEIPVLPDPNQPINSKVTPASSTFPPSQPCLGESQKMKEKQARLVTQIERRMGNLNQHGDEMSLGTFHHAQAYSLGQENAFSNDCRRACDTKVEMRPWTRTLTARELTQKLRSDSPMLLNGLISLHRLDAMEATLVIPAPGLVCSDESPCSAEGDKKGIDEVEENERTAVNEDKSSDQTKTAESEKGRDEQDELTLLRDLIELGNNNVDDIEMLDFEDQWDLLSCDVTAALEFVERRRSIEQEKEKKRIQREKIKAERRAKSRRRLRLFKKSLDEYGSDGKNKLRLSDEFLGAIQRVFEDEGGTGPKSEKSVTKVQESELNRAESERSLYLNADKFSAGSLRSKSTKQSRGTKSSAKEPDAEDETIDTDMPTSQCSQKCKTSTNKAKGHNTDRCQRRASQSRKPKSDPTLIFEAELKRQQRAKALSISSLRQEMSDQRGRSIRLPQNGLPERTKRSGQHEGIITGSPAKKSGKMHLHQDPDGEHAFMSGKYINTNSFIARSSAAPSSPWRRSPKKVATSNIIQCRSPGEKSLVKNSPPMLTRTTVRPERRWELGNHVSDLDDLKTVQLSPGKNNFGQQTAGTTVDVASQAELRFSTAPELQMLTSDDILNVPLSILPNLSVQKMPNIPNTPCATPSADMPSVGLDSPRSTAGGAYGFGTTFSDMPVAAVDEKSGLEDENKVGLLDCGWEHGEGGSGYRSKRASSGRDAIRQGGRRKKGRGLPPSLTHQITKASSIFQTRRKTRAR